jgi:hypothetical protein
MLWTNEDFVRISKTTGLSANTLKACHDVLVEGLRGAEAARKHQMFAAHVSRSVSLLVNKKQLGDEAAKNTAAKNADDLVAAKFEVGAAAKKLIGPGLTIVEAVTGNVYDGLIVATDGRFSVQHIGMFGIVHDNEKLDKPLTLNVYTTIKYSDDQQKAEVNWHVVNVNVNKFVDRRDKGGVER